MKAMAPSRRFVPVRWPGGVRLGVTAVCAVGLSLLGAHQAATTAHPDPARPVPAAADAPGGAQLGGGAAASALPWLEPGDIILMRTGTVQGMVVSASDPRTEYSHCAIVVRGGGGGQAVAVHATPETVDEAGRSRGGRAERANVGSLLADPVVHGWAIYRPRQEHTPQAIDAARWALEAARRKVPFDGGLDVDNPSRLYCSELIWRAYDDAGLDLIGGRFDTMTTWFGTRRVIYPGSLAQGPTVRRIHQHPGDGKKEHR